MVTAGSDVSDNSFGGTATSSGTGFLSQADKNSDRVVSGRKVVAAMFALGIVATAFLWTYWKLRLMPFMPMQEALAAAFPNSSPRVDNVQAKGSKAEVLRVVMRSEFDPTEDSDITGEKIDAVMVRTRDIARDHVVLSEYEILALHLYLPVKEQQLFQKTFFRDLDTWRELDVSDVMADEISSDVRKNRLKI